MKNILKELAATVRVRGGNESFGRIERIGGWRMSAERNLVPADLPDGAKPAASQRIRLPHPGALGAAAAGRNANGTAKPGASRAEVRLPVRANRSRPADIPGSGKITVKFYEQRAFRLRFREEAHQG